MKEYFSHDYNARNDQKLIGLRRTYGLAHGFIYWCIIEILYECGGKISLSKMEDIAYELHCEIDAIAEVLKFDGLFKFKNDYFYSDSVNERLSIRKKKSDKARESAAFRWGKGIQNDANAYRTESERYAIKVNKSKEEKEKEKEKEKEQPIASSVSGKKPEEKPPTKDLVEFDNFWEEYHVKTGKAKTDREAAKKYWIKLTQTERDEAMAKIQVQVLLQKDPHYRPKARTYLSDKKFKDELPPAMAAAIKINRPEQETKKVHKVLEVNPSYEEDDLPF